MPSTLKWGERGKEDPINIKCLSHLFVPCMDCFVDLTFRNFLSVRNTHLVLGGGGSDRCSDHQIEFGEKGAIVHCKNKFPLPLLPSKLNEEMQTGSETNLKQILLV